MLLSCLEDEMNGKRQRMKHICRQSQILSHITELATSMKRDPRDMVLPFFKRISEAEYFSGFSTAVAEFTDKIIKRAIEKRKEMDADEAEDAMDEDSAPLGPGGLNPFKVLAGLPQSMKDAFESQDIGRLHDVLAAMPPADAKHYMKLCVDSGLWVAKDTSVYDEGDEEGEGGEGEGAPADP
jgi:cell division cycle protein 37